MAFVFPRQQYDDPEALLNRLGSFWAEVYEGSPLVGSTLLASAQAMLQAHLDLLELVAAVSRYTVPVFHTENWSVLTIKESELNSTEGALLTFQDDATETFENNTGLQFGVPPASTLVYTVPIPDELKAIPQIYNRVLSPSLAWISGLDYWIASPGYLTLRKNPFNDPLVPQRVILTDGVPTDREAALLIFRGQYDRETVYKQFGYALKLRMTSSEGYRSLVNAILDACVHGTTDKDIRTAWSVITGIPLVIETEETVELVSEDTNYLQVITDQHVYRFRLGSTALVAAGDVVHAGDPLVDTLQFFSFNRGAVPETLTGLAVGPGVLDNGYLDALTFPNATVPTVISTDDDGRTQITFEVQGYPGDVEYFWEEVQRRGKLRGRTLAQLLAGRTDEDPPAGSLPTSINPLEFLVQNLLRQNYTLVRLRARLLGPERLGLWAVPALRRIVPPHTAVLVAIELEQQDAAVIMEGDGTDQQPGYTETLTSFPCMAASDTVDETYLGEYITLKPTVGRCI